MRHGMCCASPPSAYLEHLGQAHLRAAGKRAGVVGSQAGCQQRRRARLAGPAHAEVRAAHWDEAASPSRPGCHAAAQPWFCAAPPEKLVQRTMKEAGTLVGRVNNPTALTLMVTGWWRRLRLASRGTAGRRPQVRAVLTSWLGCCARNDRPQMRITSCCTVARVYQ